MTTVDAPPGEPTAPDGDPPVRSSRRQPAPPANRFWRWVFPLLLVAAAVAVFFLWRAGTKAVLDSSDGRVTDLVTDPAEPGYAAFVEPTPTLLVVHVDGGDLVGVSAMARTALDEGGSMTLFSRDTVVPATDPDTEAAILGQLYDTEGIDGLRRAVERMLGFGFLEASELEAEQLAGFMRLVEPIPFMLADDLYRENADGSVELWLERGQLELSGPDAATVYGWRNPGEADANRVQRQLDLWDAWLARIGDADDLLAATLPFDDGLSPYLRSLGTGTADLAEPPLTPVLFDPADGPVYVLGDEGVAWVRERGLEMVPLPVSPAGESRPRTRILDGVGDPDGRDALIPVVVEAGAVVTVLGNADAFDVAVTVVAHHRPEDAGAADDLAAELGAEVVFDEDLDAPVDLTITTGADLETG